jgi:hypothetical protein
MSSIIFHTDEKQVLVATDTLAVFHKDAKAAKFTSKALYLPHLRLIVAGTGMGGFADMWMAQINGGRLRGIEDLDTQTTAILSNGWKDYKAQLKIDESVTTTIYHFGFSETTGLIRSFAYRSTDDFKSEPLPYGVSVKPEMATPPPYSLPADLLSMMEDQRALQLKSPPEKRLYIGGEIIAHHLMEAGCSIYQVARFADYDHHVEEMFSPPPSAQTGD